MIDYDKVIEFCTEHQLQFEEFILMYTLYIRNSGKSVQLHKIMDKYYKENELNWVDMAESLEKRGFLIILDAAKFKNKLLLKYLNITEKFVNLLFCDVDDIWKKFVQRYPSTGISPAGNSEFRANIISEGDKEYFIKYILKNADKHQASMITYYLEEMFDYDTVSEKATKYANYGITKFLRNWDTLLKEFKDNQSSYGGSWTVKRCN